MLQFVCDYCGNVRKTGETWINGVAVENVGTRAARREVVIDPAWHRDRAVLPMAVHFCSVKCKDRYLAELFDRRVPVLEIQGTGNDPATGLRLVRAKKKAGSDAVRQRTTTSKRLRVR